MKIAITGGTGFVGREVVSVMKRSSKYVPIVIGRSKVKNIECEYRQTDYSINSLITVLGDVDGVVHLAARRGANESMSLFHQNEIITEKLYKTCVKLGIKNIVFASSISIYSDITKLPWKEEYLPTPNSLYGISKIASEYIGEIYHKKYGLNIKYLRIAHVLGEGERKGFMMNTFIDNAFEKKLLK